MKFRAVKAQLDGSIAGYPKVRKVRCSKCTIAYHLFAAGNIAQAEVEAQAEALRNISLRFVPITQRI